MIFPTQRFISGNYLGLMVLVGLGFGWTTVVRADQGPTTPPECALTGPGGTKTDQYMAFFDPDEYAWRLFLHLNRQGDTHSPGTPDKRKAELTKYDDDSPTVWETLALASGGRSGPFRRSIPNRSEVYLDQGATPPAWGKWARAVVTAKSLEPFQTEDPTNFGTRKTPARAAAAADSMDGRMFAAMMLFSDESVIGLEQIGEEVRTNKCAYDFIVENELYNLEGLEAKARVGLAARSPNPDLISFPLGAQEVKAKWVAITDADKPRYHWRNITDETGHVQSYGLIGLHITTRDLPNWFWTSFEHVDTEVHAEYPSIDSTTRGQKATKRGSDEGVRIETVNSKWQYYRLRGTQIDFSTSRRPVILANSQIEHGFQQSSSCMTCHSRAVVGLRAARPDLSPCQPNTLPVFLQSTEEPALDNIQAIRYGPVGSPDPNWFHADGARPRYIQTDFLWSIPFRALSKYEVVPKSAADLAKPQCPAPKSAP